MQALKTTVFPCYAAADRELAKLVADFLVKGADVRVFLEEGEMRADEDMASKAREGRMADVVLVLFSRASLPARWPRAQWEDPLVKEPAEESVRIGFARCDDCAPPKVLNPMFELSGQVTSGLRQIKRWIRGHAHAAHAPSLGPGLDALGIAIADRPGREIVADAEIAMEFTRVFRDDFDEVFFLHACAERSTTALAGDLGARLGMRLEGTPDSNLERLREFCAARRFLIVLDGECEDLVFEGRCSTLISGPGLAIPADPIREAQLVLSRCTAMWTEICKQARIGRRLLSDARRFAECYELMEQWYDAAVSQDDRSASEDARREMNWILDAWDINKDGPVVVLPDRHGQIPLPFD